MLIRVRRMTGTMRLLHWALALSVAACLVTGIYIATPFGWRGPGQGPADSLVMGNVRFVHFVFAMVLDVAFLVWAYLFFFSLEAPLYTHIVPVGQRAREAWRMLLHYFTLRNKPSTRSHADPLNAYGFIVMHFLVLVQMLTGFALMVPSFSRANSAFVVWLWLLRASEVISLWFFGTIVAVRQAHHLAGFVIVVLALCHIYVQVWRENFWTEGHISVVVSGHKYVEDDQS